MEQDKNTSSERIFDGYNRDVTRLGSYQSVYDPKTGLTSYHLVESGPRDGIVCIHLTNKLTNTEEQRPNE